MISSCRRVYDVPTEVTVPHDGACAVPIEPDELRQRREQLEAAMRDHDVEEGYEWPGGGDATDEVPPGQD
jgi:hypothetical protein